MAKYPRAYESFKRTYKDIWQAYDRLGSTSHKAGPLSSKTRELVKLGIAIGARMEGAVHSHTRKALEAGASLNEVRHVVILGLPTLGFPSTIAAKTWVEDVLGKRRSKRKRKNR